MKHSVVILKTDRHRVMTPVQTLIGNDAVSLKKKADDLAEKMDYQLSSCEWNRYTASEIIDCQHV